MSLKEKNIEYYIDGLKAGNRYILSEAITLVESTHLLKNKLGLDIISNLNKTDTQTFRIGITGSPGVGKSTFLDSMGMLLIEKGYRIAVLAVDPSSTKTKGSILGDKTRMARLAKSEDAFIRPTASGSILGGVAAHTKETILLCEAAGYDIIFVETVGVGQSETLVSQLVDAFVLLILPGSGDEIQGIKRGIMELADLIVINKSDGDRIDLARKSKKQFTSAISLFQQKIEGWDPQVLSCSGLEGTGLKKLWDNIVEFIEQSESSGYFTLNRKIQDQSWFKNRIREEIFRKVLNDSSIVKIYTDLTNKISNDEISIIEALKSFQNSLDSLTIRDN